MPRSASRVRTAGRLMRPSAAGTVRMSRCGTAARAAGYFSGGTAVRSRTGDAGSASSLAVGGRRRRLSRTMRRGWRRVGKARTLSWGSSASTVPMPVRTAQLSARRICTSCRAASPVIHWLRPSERAVLPSREAAHLRRTKGRPRSMRDRKPRLSSRASVSSRPLSVRMPAAESMARPLPATCGLGSAMAATTRDTPACIRASAQGGVRP